jgi:hypothetical protein
MSHTSVMALPYLTRKKYRFILDKVSQMKSGKASGGEIGGDEPV